MYRVCHIFYIFANSWFSLVFEYYHAYIFGHYFFMSFRLTHIHDYHRFVAVDLGLYRVRAGIYDLSAWSLVCSGFSSVRQSRKNWIDGVVADIWGIARNIEQAILQAGHTYETIPDDIIISFPSRSFVSDSITTQYTRADPDAPLTMQEIDTMIKRIEKESHERAYVKSRKQFGISNDDLRLVSSTIIAIAVDGKKVTSPIGFTGGRVRLTVLNVFVPSSEFNIIRSIISRLGKRAISLIPEPLILPKVIEDTDLSRMKNYVVDIGYWHTTVTILSDNEILGFETFPYGTEMLMGLIWAERPGYSSLQIENIICTPSEFDDPVHRECLDEFLLYIRDLIFGYLHAENINITLENLLLHGNIFENKLIRQEFANLFQETLWHKLVTKRLCEIVPEWITHDQCVVSGLSQMASELLLVRKDPLVRILRYVLYQYE